MTLPAIKSIGIAPPGYRTGATLHSPPPANRTLVSPNMAFEFSDADFLRIKQMIYDYAGISLNKNKKPMAYSRLTKRLRQLGINRFGVYLDLVEASPDDERVQFINALTTNLTCFFREEHHFPILAEHLLSTYKNEPLTVWSAACSTGEEPYSIAMAVIEAFGDKALPIRILASDLDTDALAIAKSGVYPAEKVAALSPQRLKQFFLRGTGDKSGLVRIRPQVQRLVEFRQVNLHKTDWDVSSNGEMAAIFCRNAMIYFNKETQARILDQFARLLRPDGLLFAGHSESFYHNARDTFCIRGKTVYQLASSTI